MPKRNKTSSEETLAFPSEMTKETLADTRRTRSGRTVPTPTVRTPSRRTRRSVLQELPTGDETNNEEEELKAGSPVAEDSSRICEPVPCTESPLDAADVQNDEEKHAEVESKSAATEVPPTNTDMASNKKPRLAPAVKQGPAIPLGKPKSGRVWKERNKQRFSAVVRDKQLCSSWEKKMQAKQEKDLVKQYCLQLKEENARQKEDKRKRREENLKRRAENERKAEIVQVIRNTTKIKRMKKKHLRKIEKRDTVALLQKSKDINQNTKSKTAKNTKAGPGSNLT